MPRLYIGSLIRSIGEGTKVRVLTFYRDPLFAASVVNECEALGATVAQFSFTGRTDYLWKAWRAGRQLREWMDGGDAVDVFLCQPNHLLTNYPSFSGREKTGCRVHLIPDGLANFYVTDTAPYKAGMIAKWIVGRLVALPFRRYGGNYLALGTVPYVDYWYAGSPGIMGSYLPVVPFEIPTPVRTHSGTYHRWMFVGQAPSDHPDFYATYRNVLHRAARVSAGRLDYKPHPAERDTDALRDLATEVGFRVVDDDGSPAEILALSYAGVVGIASSVLFNLKMLGWGENLYAVRDQELLEVLTGRTSEEVGQVLVAAAELGLRSLPA